MTTKRRPQFGSISTGTLRTEDLLEAFALELQSLEPMNQLATATFVFLLDEEDSGRAGRLGDETEAGRILDSLQDAINEHALPFMHFGAHYGDGADFGWWLDRDTIEEARHGVTPDDVVDGYEYLDEDDVWVYVNDHGNMSLFENADDAPGAEIWAVV